MRRCVVDGCRIDNRQWWCQRWAVEPHQRLKDERKARGLSLRELGELLCCSDSFISLIEDGKRKPGLALAFRIQKTLGIRAQMWIEDAA